MKATELARINSSYATMADSLQELEDSKEKISLSLDAHRDRLDELKKKYEQHQELDKIQLKIRGFQVKHTWAIFLALDSQYQEAVGRLEKRKAKVTKKQEEVDKVEELMANPSDEQARKQERIDQLIAEGKEQMELKSKYERELAECIAPCKQEERQLAQLRRKKVQEQTNLKAAQKRLAAYREEAASKAGNAQTEQAKRTMALSKAERELAAAREKIDELKQAVATSYRAYEEMEPRVEEAKGVVQQAQRRLEKAKGTLHRLQQSSDELALLGPNVKKVAERVGALRLPSALDRFHNSTLFDSSSRWMLHGPQDTFKALCLVPLAST